MPKPPCSAAPGLPGVLLPLLPQQGADPRLGSLGGLFVHRPRHICSPFCPLNKALGSGVTPCPRLHEFPANGHSSGNAKSFSSWMGRWGWGDPALGRVQQAQLVNTSQPVVFFHHLSVVPQLRGRCRALVHPAGFWLLPSAPHRHPAQAALPSAHECPATGSLPCPAGAVCSMASAGEGREGQLSSRARLGQAGHPEGATVGDRELSPGN